MSFLDWKPLRPAAYCTGTSSRRTALSLRKVRSKWVTSGSRSPRWPGPIRLSPPTARSWGHPLTLLPEQLRGDTVDVRADIYSVGATLFTLLTDHAPFEGDNAVQVVANAVNQKPKPLSTFPPWTCPRAWNTSWPNASPKNPANASPTIRRCAMRCCLSARGNPNPPQ